MLDAKPGERFVVLAIGGPNIDVQLVAKGLAARLDFERANSIAELVVLGMIGLAFYRLECLAGGGQGDAPIVELLFAGSNISGGGDAHGLLTGTLGDGLSPLE